MHSVLRKCNFLSKCFFLVLLEPDLEAASALGLELVLLVPALEAASALGLELVSLELKSVLLPCRKDPA